MAKPSACYSEQEYEFACTTMIAYLTLIGLCLISSISVLYHVYQRRDLTEHLLFLLFVSVILVEISYALNTASFTSLKRDGKRLCIFIGCFRYSSELSMVSIIIVMAWYYLSFVMRKMENFRQRFVKNRYVLYFLIYVFPVFLVCLPLIAKRDYDHYKRFGCILSYRNANVWALAYQSLVFCSLLVTFSQLVYCYYTEVKRYSTVQDAIKMPYFSLSLYVLATIVGFLPSLILRMKVFIDPHNDDDNVPHGEQEIFYYFTRVPCLISVLCFSIIFCWNYDNYQQARKGTKSSWSSHSIYLLIPSISEEPVCNRQSISLISDSQVSDNLM
jgi:hypothetical protein